MSDIGALFSPHPKLTEHLPDIWAMYSKLTGIQPAAYVREKKKQLLSGPFHKQ
jgi:hypothetical protein